MTKLRMSSLNPDKWIKRGSRYYTVKANVLGLHLVAEGDEVNGFVIVDRVEDVPKE